MAESKRDLRSMARRLAAGAIKSAAAELIQADVLSHDEYMVVRDDMLAIAEAVGKRRPLPPEDELLQLVREFASPMTYKSADGNHRCFRCSGLMVGTRFIHAEHCVHLRADEVLAG